MPIEILKKHNIRRYVIKYPFGEFMTDNVKRTKCMIKEFISLSSDDLSKSDNIILVCMGCSGAIISTLFYDLLKKKYKDIKITICHVKKNGEESHISGGVSGLVSSMGSLSPIYIWVDDFIDAGDTIINCHAKLKKHLEKNRRLYKVAPPANFKFDYAVCSIIQCSIKKVEKITNNIVYNFL